MAELFGEFLGQYTQLIKLIVGEALLGVFYLKASAELFSRHQYLNGKFFYATRHGLYCPGQITN